MPLTIATCHVPAGTYPVGSRQFAVSQPEHTVTLDAFNIGKYVVTNTQFAEFLLAGGYDDESLWTEMGWRWRKATHPDKLRPAYLDDRRFNHPFQPIVGVGWYDAVAFTRWLSRETGGTWRLPSEIEWEAAARGNDAFVPAPENTLTSAHGTAARGAQVTWKVTQGAVSPCGAVGMCGNVWEWTLSRWGRNWQSLDYRYPYHKDDGREDINGSHARVMRGGSYFDPPRDAHPANRGRFLPGSRASNIGFRVLQIIKIYA